MQAQSTYMVVDAASGRPVRCVPGKRVTAAMLAALHRQGYRLVYTTMTGGKK